MQQADNPDPYVDPFNVRETLRQGDTLLYLINFSPNGKGPIDITGYTFVFTAKVNRSDPDSAAVVQNYLTAPSGPQSQSGKLAFEAVPTGISKNIPANVTYAMDLRYTTTANQVGTLVDGTMTIVQPVGISLTPS